MDEMVSARFASAGLTSLAIFCCVPESQSRLRIHTRAFNTGRTKNWNVDAFVPFGPFFPSMPMVLCSTKRA